MKRKTNFTLEFADETAVDAVINIVGQEPNSSPYVSIEIGEEVFFIGNKDLKLFAKNLAKALEKSQWKHL